MRRMSDENEREREIRELQDELDALKERLSKISGDTNVLDEPIEKEPVIVLLGVPEEAEERFEDTAEVSPDESPEKGQGWDEEEDYRFNRRDYDFKYDFGDRLGDYISSFVEDVMEGVSAEIDRSFFLGSGRIGVGRRRPRGSTRVNAKAAASVMSALGNEHRISALEALSSGGLYASDLQDILPQISPSTLSSHLDILEEAGLIIQERKRGRYLITIPGRLAIRMANQIAKRTVSDT